MSISVIKTHIRQPLFINHRHPYTPLTDSHALSYTLPHILFHSPSTHPHVHFPRTFILFLGFFPCLSPPIYLAPSHFPHALSLFCDCIHTHKHTVILSLSHQGILIKLGWSLMLSPRQQSPWRGWLFQKKKKTCAFYSHTTCTVPFAHTESDAHMHEQLDKTISSDARKTCSAVTQTCDEYRRDCHTVYSRRDIRLHSLVLRIPV